jgi:isocitrate/isopropylmalate dehydrogenase
MGRHPLAAGRRDLDDGRQLLVGHHRRIGAGAPVLEAAIARVIKEGKVKTYDMGGKNTTIEVAKEVARYAG